MTGRGRRRRSPTFLFLGADQDSYATGESLSLKAGSVANWDKSKDGVSKMWRDVSHSTAEYRRRSRDERQSGSDDVYREAPEGD